MAMVRRSAKVMVVVDDWQCRLRRRFVIGVGDCCMFVCFGVVLVLFIAEGVTDILCRVLSAGLFYKNWQPCSEINLLPTQ